MTKNTPFDYLKLFILLVCLGIGFYLVQQKVRVQEAEAAGQNIFGINNRDGNWNNLEVRQWMKDTGARYIRASIWWASCQPSKTSAINVSCADSYLLSMINEGMIPVVYITGAPSDIATYPGGPYNLVNGNTTYITEFMYALASRYNGRTVVNGQTLPKIDWWAMYNEPDSLDVNSDSWDANSYADILRAVYPAIKQGNPDAKVIFGGVAAENIPGAFDINFTNNVLSRLQQNGGVGFDVFDLHFYPYFQYAWDKPSENNYWLTAKVNYFRSLLGAYGRNVPIIVTETGRKSLETPVKGEAPSETAQGNWYWKMHTQALHDSLPIIILFSMNDIGSGTGNSWGILNRSFSGTVTWSKKASYDSYKQSVTVLSGSTYSSRIDTFSGMEVHTLIKADGSPLTVFWSREPTVGNYVNFPVTAGGSLSVYNIYGVATQYQDANGDGVVNVWTANPVYTNNLPVGVTQIASCPAEATYDDSNPTAIANYCVSRGVSCTTYASPIHCHVRQTASGGYTWDTFGPSCTQPYCDGCACAASATPSSYGQFSPVGTFDGADCTQFYGWAGDQDNLNLPVEIHFYANGPYGGGGTLIGTTTANISRESAVCSALGGTNCGVCPANQSQCQHGFTFTTPASLKENNPHVIYAYGLNLSGTGGTNVLLPWGNPKTITCSQTPLLPDGSLWNSLLTIPGAYNITYDLWPIGSPDSIINDLDYVQWLNLGGHF